MLKIEDIAHKAKLFRDARDWSQFHSAKNLIASISIEASELLETCQWLTDAEVERKIDDESFKREIAHECADVLIYLILLADRVGIDLLAAAADKIDTNEERYPVDKARGTSKKYDQL